MPIDSNICTIDLTDTDDVNDGLSTLQFDQPTVKVVRRLQSPSSSPVQQVIKVS